MIKDEEALHEELLAERARLVREIHKAVLECDEAKAKVDAVMKNHDPETQQLMKKIALELCKRERK